MYYVINTCCDSVAMFDEAAYGDLKEYLLDVTDGCGSENVHVLKFDDDSYSFVELEWEIGFKLDGVVIE